ncbi:MAG: DUF3817 domain-containing protein [Planctomycetota bacterium]|nr:MAG: DUF3817 domain-containing protein [Planctomycetota bacterium]
MSEAQESPDTAPLPAAVSGLRITGLIEGTSTLVLFGIAMPLKYLADMPMAVTIVGSVHGLLFVIYILWAWMVVARYRWPFLRFVTMAIGAVIPFGPFIVDRWIPGWYRSSLAQDRPAPSEMAN